MSRTPTTAGRAPRVAVKQPAGSLAGGACAAQGAAEACSVHASLICSAVPRRLGLIEHSISCSKATSTPSLDGDAPTTDSFGERQKSACGCYPPKGLKEPSWETSNHTVITTGVTIKNTELSRRSRRPEAFLKATCIESQAIARSPRRTRAQRRVIPRLEPNSSRTMRSLDQSFLAPPESARSKVANLADRRDVSAMPPALGRNPRRDRLVVRCCPGLAWRALAARCAGRAHGLLLRWRPRLGNSRRFPHAPSGKACYL